MFTLTTKDCKEFLVEYFQSRNAHTTISEWKRTRKYKVKEICYRDFEHSILGNITLKEINGFLIVVTNSIITNNVVTNNTENKKPSMASLYENMFDERCDHLIGGSVEKTIQSLLYKKDDEYELISCDTEAVDDNDNPVTGYYFHSQGRDYTLWIYADQSWISSSD